VLLAPFNDVTDPCSVVDCRDGIPLGEGRRVASDANILVPHCGDSQLDAVGGNNPDKVKVGLQVICRVVDHVRKGTKHGWELVFGVRSRAGPYVASGKGYSPHIELVDNAEVVAAAAESPVQVGM
jgi:hypothetical protein